MRKTFLRCIQSSTTPEGSQERCQVRRRVGRPPGRQFGIDSSSLTRFNVLCDYIRWFTNFLDPLRSSLLHANSKVTVMSRHRSYYGFLEETWHQTSRLYGSTKNVCKKRATAGSIWPPPTSSKGIQQGKNYLCDLGAISTSCLIALEAFIWRGVL